MERVDVSPNLTLKGITESDSEEIYGFIKSQKFDEQGV